MPQVFANTFYWIALLNPADKWHQSARTFSQVNPEVSVVTTDALWTEVLNYFSEAGPKMREAAAALCDQTMAHARATVLAQTREVFVRGFDLYKNRPDKSYSLTDCISMVEMRGRSIREVLTHDHHFAQEGFDPLFR